MNSLVEDSLTRVEGHRDLLMSGQGTVQPGQPLNFTEAAQINDGIAQGDLDLVIRAAVPEGYKLRNKNDGGQLVPGNTTGAKHVVLDPLSCDIFDPPGWGPTYDELKGPFIVAREATTIGHPTHGAVTIPAGFTVGAEYQRVWDQELAKERRQRD